MRLTIDTFALDVGDKATGATRLRDGGFVVRVASEPAIRLARYSADGDFTGLLRMPDVPPRLPDAREIEIFKEEFAGTPLGRASDRAVEGFSSRPMPRLARNLVNRTIQMDPDGRVLVLTTDRSSTGTYLEVYTGLEYTGRAHLRGRVLGIQMVDRILVALSEEMPSDDLIPTRRLEWYEF